MDPKIVNTEDNDTLNPLAGTRNYGACNEADKRGDMEDGLDREDDGVIDDVFDEPEIKDDEPLPDEIVDPAEDDSADEMP